MHVSVTVPSEVCDLTSFHVAHWGRTNRMTPHNRLGRIAITATAVLVAACSDAPMASVANDGSFNEDGIALDIVGAGEGLPFTPLPTSAGCVAGGAVQQMILPAGYAHTVLAAEGPGFADLADMNTVNETGSQRGRFLYRTHEVGSNASVAVTDLLTGASRIVAERQDWERFDGIAWTPWGTLIAAEEATVSSIKDPQAPDAVGGHVYEIHPTTGAVTLLRALGARSHEGLRFDNDGNVYGISETTPGYIYKFVPDRQRNLSRGQLYALKIVQDLGDRTGWADWVPLNREAVQINSVAEATANLATGYGRPEDLEIGTSTGDDKRGNNILYAAITSEDRVLAINLKPGSGPGQAFVSDYIRDGVNAPSDFDAPDNLALDRAGNLYITEDPGGTAGGGKTSGDDVWFAPFNAASAVISLPVERFLSLTDCDAEPTGVYLSPTGKTLFVNIQHRGGADTRDLAVRVTRLSDILYRPVGH
jgi:uncharacterized protein